MLTLKRIIKNKVISAKRFIDNPRLALSNTKEEFINNLRFFLSLPCNKQRISIKIQLILASLVTSLTIYTLSNIYSSSQQKDIISLASYGHYVSISTGLTISFLGISCLIASFFYIITTTNGCAYREGDFFKIIKSVSVNAPAVSCLFFVFLCILNQSVAGNHELFKANYILSLFPLYLFYKSSSQLPNIGKIRAFLSTAINTLWIYIAFLIPGWI